MSKTRQDNVRTSAPSTHAPLARYREAFHGSCSTYDTTLFDLTDALLTSPGPVCCPAHLSLEATVSHCAFYKALTKGTIDTDALRLVQLDLFKEMDLDPVFTVDCTAVARPDSPTSPGRHMHHLGNRLGRQPGWCYQVIVAQVPGHNSWNLPIEVTRVGLGSDKERAALESMATISTALGRHCTFVFDAGYSSSQLTFLARARGLNVTILVRLARHQVMFEGSTAAAYGPRFELKDRGTRRAPDATYSWVESSYGEVSVSVTGPLRMRATREKSPWLGPRYVDGHSVPIPKTDGTVLEVKVDKMPGSTKDGRLWLWCSTGLAGATEAQVQAVVRAYFHRFDIEHMFRFLKQTLGLGEYSCQQPEAFDTWFNLVLAAFTQLLLARHDVGDRRLPWEKKRTTLTPGRVRRALKYSLRDAWRPVGRSFVPRAGPGARKGVAQRPRARHPVTKAEPWVVKKVLQTT